MKRNCSFASFLLLVRVEKSLVSFPPGRDRDRFGEERVVYSSFSLSCVREVLHLEEFILFLLFATRRT